MAPQTATDGTSDNWSTHRWSSEVVFDAISKSPKIIKLVSKDGGLVVPVHKELLCFFSSYYSAALNGKFLEAEKGQFEVDLSDERLKTFTGWLYTGDVFVDEGAALCYMELYIFADLVDIIALRRETITQLSEMTELEPRYETVRSGLKNITQYSQLYKWLMDVYVAHWEPEHDDDDPCLYNGDTDPDYLLVTFMYQVMRGVANRDKTQDWKECSCCHHPCEYHEHSSKEEWEATCGLDKHSEMPASLRKAEQAKCQDDENSRQSNGFN